MGIAFANGILTLLMGHLKKKKQILPAETDLNKLLPAFCTIGCGLLMGRPPFYFDFRVLCPVSLLKPSFLEK